MHESEKVDPSNANKTFESLHAEASKASGRLHVSKNIMTPNPMWNEINTWRQVEDADYDEEAHGPIIKRPVLRPCVFDDDVCELFTKEISLVKQSFHSRSWILQLSQYPLRDQNGNPNGATLTLEWKKLRTESQRKSAGCWCTPRGKQRVWFNRGSFDSCSL